MAKHVGGYRTGRPHPAVKPVPNSGSIGSSRTGRDARPPSSKSVPQGGTVTNTGPTGRDSPAVKGIGVPGMSDPFGRQ